MTKAFVGQEDLARIQGAVNTGIDVQPMVSMGMPAVSATVITLADTGQLVNYDPIVDLVVRFDESRAELRTIVSKVAVPGPGDEVRLIADPRRPGTYLYAGIA